MERSGDIFCNILRKMQFLRNTEFILGLFFYGKKNYGEAMTPFAREWQIYFISYWIMYYEDQHYLFVQLDIDEQSL